MKFQEVLPPIAFIVLAYIIIYVTNSVPLIDGNAIKIILGLSVGMFFGILGPYFTFTKRIRGFNPAMGSMVGIILFLIASLVIVIDPGAISMSITILILSFAPFFLTKNYLKVRK